MKTNIDCNKQTTAATNDKYKAQVICPKHPESETAASLVSQLGICLRGSCDVRETCDAVAKAMAEQGISQEEALAYRERGRSSRTLVNTSPHPAPFPAKLIDRIRPLLHRHGDPALADARLLDPFAGVGAVTELGATWDYHGCEIEPEWARQAERKGMSVHVGTAEKMPWPDEYFSAIVTSPAYGNRLADSYAPDLSDPKHGKRRSYRIFLGRELTAGSGASEHWGEQYRHIHQAVWRKCTRVLAPGGMFILNCKDHVRDGHVMRVTEWHVRTLIGLGLVPVEAVSVKLRGDQNTNSMRSRGVQVVDHEWLVVMRRPGHVDECLSPDDAEAWISVNMSDDENKGQPE